MFIEHPLYARHLEYPSKQNMCAPCPFGVYILAGERDARALITPFYFLAILVTAEGGPGCQTCVSEELDGRREVWEEMSILLGVSLSLSSSLLSLSQHSPRVFLEGL